MVPPGDGDRVIGDGRDVLAGPEAREQRLEVDARLGDGQQVGVRATRRGDLVEQLARHGVERHGGSSGG